MAVLSLTEVPALKKMMETMGYNIRVHDACGGQVFDVDPIEGKALYVTDDAVSVLESFFAAHRMKIYFQNDARRNFIAK